VNDWFEWLIIGLVVALLAFGVWLIVAGPTATHVLCVTLYGDLPQAEKTFKLYGGYLQDGWLLGKIDRPQGGRIEAWFKADNVVAYECEEGKK